MNLKQIVTGSFFVGTLAFTSFCQAGWSSGGGELIRDANNPWFLSNTKNVKYCIQIDEKRFGQTKQQVRERISKALQFWQMQLKDLQYINITSNFDVSIGTQQFKEENCTTTTDIVFQFGILTMEQKNKLKDLSKTIGITVRTDYDEVNMKGKGFVYIAPESGDLKPTIDLKIDKMWSNFEGSLLFPVLIHEVGHIFGLKHDSDVLFMGEDIVDDVFANASNYLGWWNEFEKNEWLSEKVFKHNPFAKPMQLLCLTHSEPVVIPIDPNDSKAKKRKGSRKFLNKQSNDHMDLKKFFNISDEYDCINSYIQEGKFVISAQIKNDLNHKSVVLGEMSLQATHKMFADKGVIKVWFPEVQKVIPEVISGAFSIGAMYSEVYYKGNYVSLDGKTTRRIVVTANPNGVKNLGGTLKGEIYQSINDGF